MNIEELKKRPIVDRFMYWITEREKVRLAKEAGEPKPWSDFELFHKFKFCNVRRLDDRVSQWLLKNWYEPFYDHKNMLVAVTIARLLNNTDSLEAIGFPKKWDPVKVEKILEDRSKQRLKNFAAAYMVTGTLGGTKVHQVVMKVADPLYRDPPKIGKTLEELVGLLVKRPGFSTFMAGQVSADLRWALDRPWEDRHTYAPMGPGSRRGLNRLAGRAKGDRMKPEQFRVELAEYIDLCKNHLPKSITSRMEAIDYQNTLCECDKMERTIWGQGRPKQKYQGLPS